MAGIKKSLSFLIVGCIILSSIAFAQSASTNVSASANSDNKNFESSGSFDSGMSSNGMVQSSINHEPGEDEMRAMAKERMGDEFSEEEFQRMIKSRGQNNLNERSFNQDDFSYEQKGFEHRYDAGPSYEGYSKENMIFAMVFENIGGDFDPREIKDKCSNPDKLADYIINKLKERVGDIKSLCSKMEKQEASCDEETKTMCSRIGTPSISGNSDEMEKVQSVAASCPVNKDAIIQSCMLRSKSYIEQHSKTTDSMCEQRANSASTDINRECENYKSRQICDKDAFVQQCLTNSGARKDDENGERKACPKNPIPECKDGARLETKRDVNGCESYHCIQSTSQCPTPTEPKCAQGETLQKKSDERGCIYYFCQASANTCPEISQPTCSSNTHLEKRTDQRGCVSYYCASNPCAEVSRPSCSSGERMQAYYDNAGCVASYQCIKEQAVCPEPSKPTCSEGQSITTRYDSNKCPSYECVTITTSSSSSVTGAVVFNNYDDFVRECDSKWSQQERICKTMQSNCDKGNFVDRCKESSKQSLEQFKANVEEICKTQTVSQILALEDKCSRMDKEKQRCAEQTEKRCSQMKGLSEKCASTLTDDNLRKFIIQESQKRCRFSDKLENRENITKSNKVEIVLAVVNTVTESDLDKLRLFVNDLKEEMKLESTTVFKGNINPNNFGDIKLLPFVVNAKISTSASSERSQDIKENLIASKKAEETASKLASLRDSDVPNEYLYIIEGEASEVLNVSDNLDEIEKNDDQKGIGYKMKRFLGLAKQAEQEEIRQLQESKSKLQNSIETLTRLIDEVPSDVAKAILKEQVEDLKQQQADIQSLIDAKEKKAKGFFGIFG
ncbi:MAG TPA: hypothetical protein VJJ52_04540 [Candidatus Nanoarchaeia archaeon]|nr:hypothetical protein [Candidatus Nanoarchaeia archaeon]